ncbi:SDR family NAD(P)-dependent oxidoreductase [Spongiactinospora sp. 9N601]|uniref:SDR family NAD(P)-dependent oxidoreductase n=1 Tax=Spongiactinospora sp. 9N601 TaxID=3375149 RepID=UPI0037A58FE7
MTGGGRGIGRCIAETLALQGARVAVGDLEPPDVPGLTGVRMDVTDEGGVAEAVREVEHALGPVEILVCNAGIYRTEPLAETTLRSWEQSLAVNLTGVFLSARQVVPGMAERGYGRVVIMGSSAGKTGGARDTLAYAAAKAGAMALAKGLAKEFAGAGVTVNALAPALVDTDMISEMRELVERIPVGRLGTPQDVADLVAFLVSDHASFITGEVVDINGGFLID